MVVVMLLVLPLPFLRPPSSSLRRDMRRPWAFLPSIVSRTKNSKCVGFDLGGKMERGVVDENRFLATSRGLI